jgi:hypothetical protein
MQPSFKISLARKKIKQLIDKELDQMIIIRNQRKLKAQLEKQIKNNERNHSNEKNLINIENGQDINLLN